MTKRQWPVLVLGAAAFSVVGANIPASAASGTSGTEHVLILETSPTGNTFPLAATGPIHAAGKDVQLNDNKDRFVFPKGTLDITHERTSGGQSFDKVTCTGRFTEKGIYHVVGGTKAYANASGRGTYSLVGYFMGCNPKKPPTTFALILQAAGPLHLPG
jgi:hypothetical protein